MKKKKAVKLKKSSVGKPKMEPLGGGKKAFKTKY